jgi:hypothetical protein
MARLLASWLALVESGDLLDSPEVSASPELAAQKHLQRVGSYHCADKARSEADHVRLVVLAGQSR